MQGEVNLGDLLLVLHRANGIVDIRILVDGLAVHRVDIVFTPAKKDSDREFSGGGGTDSGAALATLKSIFGQLWLVTVEWRQAKTGEAACGGGAGVRDSMLRVQEGVVRNVCWAASVGCLSVS
jgi:hypothetical protein